MHQLLDFLSAALGLSHEESLSQYHVKCNSTLSLIRYPPLSASKKDTAQIVRNPAHSDFGSLTLLFQDRVGGLEVADMSSTQATRSVDVERSGTFRPINPVPRDVIVNAGYLLMRWSNGRWKNAVHRVVASTDLEGHGNASHSTILGTSDLSGVQIPAQETYVPERYSLAFFGTPDPETLIQPLPHCPPQSKPQSWKPMNAGDYLTRKRAATLASSSQVD